MLSAGSLNCRVQIQKNSGTQNNLGEFASDWVTVATVWADIRYLNGKEYLASQLETNKASVSIRIRWRNDIEPTMRILSGNLLYNIEAVLPDMQKRVHIDLVCSTEINRNKQ